jgi:NADPH2:quinone reductase
MRAVRIETLDGPRAVRLAEVDEPAGGDQVLIDVHAAGVCFPEVLQTRGRYQIKPDLPFIPGSELAGVVRSAPESAGVRAGDRVAAFPGLGGFAEVAAVAPAAVGCGPGRPCWCTAAQVVSGRQPSSSPQHWTHA